MTEAARDFKTIPAPTTEGLEEFFDVRERDAPMDANLSLDCSSVREEGANVVRLDANMVTVEEAAERLGVSPRAVQKRLKKGTLSGRKEKTSHGERWLIDVRELDSNLSLDGSFVRETTANPVRLDATRDEHRDVLIKEMQAKIEALTWRNGYLESQLENQREQIKLLTDSQHETKWWHKVRSWFAGQ